MKPSFLVCAGTVLFADICGFTGKLDRIHFDCCACGFQANDSTISLPHCSHEYSMEFPARTYSGVQPTRGEPDAS
jgi:hypothetical protein